MSEIKTKIRTYNDVVDLFGEEKAADMLSEALDWSTIDSKNDKKNIMERKALLLDPYMTYEDEDYCKHIVAGFLGDRDLGWASGYIDEEKIKNGQVMPADLKSALSMALDNELSTSWAYLDALSSQCAEICNKFAGYIESAGLARGVLVPGEYELDSNALNADVSERFNIQYGFQCDQMIDAMQFDMTLILTEKVDSMDGYRLIQSVCDWREENLEVIEDAENNLDYGKVPSYVAYERPADIGTTIIDELCASQGTAVEKLVNYPTTKFERTMRNELFEALAVNETTISLMAKVPSSVFLDAVACMDSRYMSGHTVDTGHAFIVSPGTYEPYIGIHDPVYGAGYMMVDLDKPFEVPMNRIWIAMDDYSGPETKEGLRGMYHSPQDVSAFSDPFCGSVSVTPTRDEKQEPAKSGLEAKRDACAISAVLEPRPNTPYVFRRAGFDNLPFIYTQRHLRNAIAPKEADSHQHGLTIEQIKSLPEKLEEPVVVFDQPNYTVNGRTFEGKGVAAVLDMYDPDGVPVIAYFFPNGYGTKTNDNGCSNVIASLYGRDNFTSYLARAANEEKILYIDSEKYEQMEKELPRYGGTRFPPALAALSMDIIIPSSYICKMKAEINPKLSDREREHNSLNRTMHIKIADSRRNRLAQDRDKPRNINLRYDDDNHDSQ